MIGKIEKKMLEFNFANEGENIFSGNLISRMKDQFAKFAKFSSREIF